jgi:hypothetical protein
VTTAAAPPNEEKSTVTDIADEVRDDGTFVVVANDEPVILNLEEESAKMNGCDYCGHYPCGCGG